MPPTAIHKDLCRIIVVPFHSSITLWPMSAMLYLLKAAIGRVVTTFLIQRTGLPRCAWGVRNDYGFTGRKDSGPASV